MKQSVILDSSNSTSTQYLIFAERAAYALLHIDKLKSASFDISEVLIVPAKEYANQPLIGSREIGLLDGYIDSFRLRRGRLGVGFGVVRHFRDSGGENDVKQLCSAEIL